MKKLTVILSLIGFSLLLGAGLTVMTAQDAQALWCPTYSYHITDTGNYCSCNDGRIGTILIVCQGYWEDGSDCGCWSYCSPCPPKNRDYPLPAIYVPPGGDR